MLELWRTFSLKQASTLTLTTGWIDMQKRKGTCYMPPHLTRGKLLNATQFKQKVEAQIRQVNMALEASASALCKLQTISEAQMEACDHVAEENETRATINQYNLASDINDWAEAIVETLD